MMTDQGWNQDPGQPPAGAPTPPPAGDPAWGAAPPPAAPPPAAPQGQWSQPPQPGAPQPQWGQQPQWDQQPQWGQQPAGGGLEPNVAAMLAYLLLGWIGGLIMYLTQEHPEVRFHGAQSILLFGGIFVVQVVLTVIPFGFLLGGLLGLFAFGMWIFMSIQGYQMNHLKLPVIGDIAEQWAAKPA